MAAATARERHAARTRIQRAPARPQRRVSGPAHPVAKPHAVPRPATGVFARACARCPTTGSSTASCAGARGSASSASR